MRFKPSLLLFLTGLLLVVNLFNINTVSAGTKSAIPTNASTKGLPDLTVSDIFLTDLNQLAIEITNQGAGNLGEKYWGHSQVSFHIYLEGKLWGGISLKICDPSQKLHYPRSKIIYISKNLIIEKTSQIRIVVDPQDMIRESNETNNSLQKLVICATPDLAVKDLWVVNGNRLAVQLMNNGTKRIDLKYWDQIPVYLEIHLNGRRLVRTLLKAIDPHRKLAEPNGRIIYITRSFLISHLEEINAIIDSQNTIPEGDENNNRFTKIITRD